MHSLWIIETRCLSQRLVFMKIFHKGILFLDLEGSK